MPYAAAGSILASMHVTWKGVRVRIDAATEGGSTCGCGGHVPTAYFFAGGRARLPSVKLEAYCLFLDTRFSWMVEGMFELAYELFVYSAQV